MKLTGLFFGKRMWEVFGDTLIGASFKRTFLYQYFNGQYRRAIKAANYWKDEREELDAVVVDNDLVRSTEFDTVKRVMTWVNTTYPSQYYYKSDKGETWNTPLTTLMLFEARKDDTGTDCDDYAILIYSLCRVAGVSQDVLRLCFMKTRTEWHLNMMYLHEGKIPYAVEGTYHPAIAQKHFGVTNYFYLRYNGCYYYSFIKFLFNEDYSWKRKY